MQPPPDIVLNANDSIEVAFQKIQNSAADVYLVRLVSGGWSIVTPDSLKHLVDEGKSHLTLGSALLLEKLPYLHPDYPLGTALHYVYQMPLVPVLSRADLRKLEGVISSEAVSNAYRLARPEEESD